MIRKNTFVFLQPTDLFEDRLQVHVEPVAVAEQLQEVAGANGTTGVVDELAGRRQTVREDFKFLPLREREERGKKKKKHMNVDYRTLWFIAGSNIRLWNRNVDFKLWLRASKAQRQTTEEEQSLFLKLLCSQTQCSNQLIYLVLRLWNNAFLSSFGDSPGRGHVGWMHGKTKMAGLCFLPFFWQKRASITAVFSVSGVVFNADL